MKPAPLVALVLALNRGKSPYFVLISGRYTSRGRPDHLTASEHSDRGCGEADSTADTGSSSRTRRRRCSVLHLSSLSRAPLDFEVSTPALPTFTADVGFVGEVPDPLRVSPSP